MDSASRQSQMMTGISRSNNTEPVKSDVNSKTGSPFTSSSAWSQLKSKLTCPLCGVSYDFLDHKPMLMHVGHSACEACVSKHRKLQQEKGEAANNEIMSASSEFTCPICDFSVVLDPASSLPYNFLLNDLMELKALLEAPDVSDSVLSPRSASPRPTTITSPSSSPPVGAAAVILRCHECADPALLDGSSHHLRELAVSPVCALCEHCSAFLCSFHTEAHRRSRVTASHADRIRPLSEVKSRIQQRFSTEGAEGLALWSMCAMFRNTPPLVPCEIHPLMHVEHFCKDCNRAFCVGCASSHATDFSHSPNLQQQHTVIELSTYYRQLIAEMQDFSLPSLHRAHYESQYDLLALEQKQARVNAEFQDRVVKLESQFARIVQALDARKSSLLSDLESHRTASMDVLKAQMHEKSARETVLRDAKSDVAALVHTRHATGLCALQTKLQRELAVLATTPDAVQREIERFALPPPPSVDLLRESPQELWALLQSMGDRAVNAEEHSKQYAQVKQEYNYHPMNNAANEVPLSTTSLSPSFRPSTSGSASFAVSAVADTFAPAATSVSNRSAFLNLTPSRAPVVVTSLALNRIPPVSPALSSTTVLTSAVAASSLRHASPSRDSAGLSTSTLSTSTPTHPRSPSRTRTRSRSNSLSRTPSRPLANADAFVDPSAFDHHMPLPASVSLTPTPLLPLRSTDELRAELARAQEIYQRYLQTKTKAAAVSRAF